MVRMGRITTVLLMVIAGFLSLALLDNATDAFNILLLSGAGSGAICLLRWYCYRINALTEIVAIAVATIVAVVLVLFVEDSTVAIAILDGFTVILLITVSLVTVAWQSTTLLTKPKMKRFCVNSTPSLIRVALVGRPLLRRQKLMVSLVMRAKVAWQMPRQLLMVFVGAVVIYSALFSIGGFVYGNITQGLVLGLVSTLGTFILFKLLAKLHLD